MHDEDQSVDTPIESDDLRATIEAATGASEDETQAPPGAAPTAEPEIDIPASWKDDARPHWESLPRELRAVVAERERQRDSYLTKTGQEAATYRKQIEQFQQLYEPHRGSYGDANPFDVIKSLFAADQALRTNPQAAISWLAQQHGISFPQPQQAQEQEWVDPHVLALRQQMEQKLAQYDGVLQRLAHGFTEQQNAATTAQQRAVVRGIDTWASEKDASGNPRRPHFDAVINDLPHFIGVARARNGDATPSEILDMAYDLAVWGNADLRNKLIAQQSQQQVEQARVTANKHRNAAASIKGAPGVGGSLVDRNSANGDLRSMITEAVNNHI